VARPAALLALLAAVAAVALVVGDSWSQGRSNGQSESTRGLATLPGTAGSGVYPRLHPVAELAAPGLLQTDSGWGVYPALRAPARLTFPAPAALAAAGRFVRRRAGAVSFAVGDDRGGLRGVGMDRPYRSASLVKAMILVAYLRKAARAHAAIPASDRESLGYMIRLSDNGSTDVIYREVGDPEIRALARAAGMTRFSISDGWSEARVTAADQVRFFLAIDDLTPPRYRELERDLLETIMAEQSWGIPVASRPGWRTYFKGGWRPDSGGELVHQAAYLERGRRRVAIAVLTGGAAEMDYGERTIEGVARRLLAQTEGPLLSHDRSSRRATGRPRSAREPAPGVGLRRRTGRRERTSARRGG
jgi:hypothetical protein